MKGNTLISVIIPTYNRKKTIVRAINSVLKQTYKNWELLIIDDGSTDNTKSVLKKYLSNNSITYYKTKNLGVCHARNFGIKNARGKYIAFLDSDDEFKVNRLKSGKEEMGDGDVDFILCNFDEFRENKKIKKRFNYKKSFNITKDDIVKYKVPMSASYMFIKKQLAEKVLFDEGLPSSNDFDFVLKCTDKGSMLFSDKRIVNTYKTFKIKRISTNYEGKISGYRIILNKTKKGFYNLDKESKKELLKRTYFNLLLFCFISNKLSLGRNFYKEFLGEFPRERNNVKFKILIFSLKFPKIGRIIIKTARAMWSLGVIQN